MMSEELFDKSKDNQIRQNGLIMNTDEVVDLLNSQSKLISAYNYEFAKMSKENKKLKEMNEQLNLAIDDLLTHTSCEEVKKENSDLRQNIKIIKDLLSECDLFSDKATEHDIIAYRELHKFDNKDAYSIACAIAKIKKVIDV